VELPERLLKSIRKQGLIKAGDRVAGAVSGGADSVALLLLLLELRKELGIVLSVAHVNHKLRGEESDADQLFVEDLCNSHGLALHCRSAPLQTGTAVGIEAAARALRYSFFRELAGTNPGMKIATAHTLDDQAETVLLRVLRGTGIRGLAGIHPRITLAEEGQTVGEVVRPLLGFRRAELEEFLHQREQTWREDSTNRDPAFLRNRVRHALLPLLKKNFGPAVVENLSDLAEIARSEDEHWLTTHPEVLAQVGNLNVNALRSLPLAAQRRLLRSWIELHAPATSISFRVIEEALDLADSAPGKVVEISRGNGIRRTRDGLLFETNQIDCEGNDYKYSLPIPGEVVIPELNIRLQAAITDPTQVSGSDKMCLLDQERLPPVLTLRNWRPGDRFWPAHTKEARKVKDLLNERHIVGREKRLWPVLVARDELIWIRGFPIPASFQPSPDAKQAVRICATSTFKDTES
jgi:tRNA(Ile)-lysidine synthase